MHGTRRDLCCPTLRSTRTLRQEASGAPISLNLEHPLSLAGKYPSNQSRRKEMADL